jgi:hypothetical protein
LSVNSNSSSNISLLNYAKQLLHISLSPVIQQVGPLLNGAKKEQVDSCEHELSGSRRLEVLEELSRY